MSNIIMTFPDGNKKEFEKNSTILEIAGSISSSLKKKAVAGTINGDNASILAAMFDIIGLF